MTEIPVPMPVPSGQLEELIKRFVPIDRLNIQNHSISADADIFNIRIEPVSPPCLFRIMAAFSAAGVLSVVIRKGVDIEVLKLFEGNALVADCLYMCDMNVHQGDRVSLRYSSDATIRVLKIQEISRGV
jgi:hypothetical protein